MAKKAALGKGLDSLFSTSGHEVNAVRTPETSIAISKIKPFKGQPRKIFNPEELSELADSIQQNGILQPLLVRKKGSNYEIVAGERRYQAAKIAGLTELPVIVREVNDTDIFRLALIENLQRSDLTPIEEARGYRELIDKLQLTQEAVAKAVSKSRSAITNTLRLLDLPEEIQDMLLEGRITAGHARALLSVSNEEAALKLAEKIITENLSVRETERLAPLFSVTKEEIQPRVPTPKSYKRAASKLRLFFNTNVKVKQVRGKNKIEIEFNGEEDLERILSLLEGID